MNKMHIILDNIIFSLQKSGGISTLWGELINKLGSKNQNDFSCLEYKNANNNIVRKTLNIIPNNLELKNDNVTLNRFFNPSIDRKDPFIFFSSYYRTSKNKNAINVTVVHDFTHEIYFKGIRKFVFSRQKRKAIKNSDAIICISENTRKDLIRFVPDVDASKIKVIYNGVAECYYKIDEKISWKDIDKKNEVLDKKKCLVFVGSREKYKNFDQTIKVIEILPDDYHLIIVGKQLSNNEKKYLDNNIKERYTSFSDINNETLNKIYNKSFALLYLSSYEGFGIPILEAMKTSLPVIAYNRSSIPEVTGNSAILLENLNPINVKNAILNLEDEHTYNSLSKKSLIQSMKFSWSKTMDQYLDYFQEVYDKKTNKII